MSDYYLNPGLAQPASVPLDEPYWTGLREEVLRVQRCNACQGWQWGPEWICHHCHSDDLSFCEVAAQGVIYSYERVWHPVHPALKDQGPYIVLLVELPHAGDIRMVGNLLGDAEQAVPIGATVEGVYEHHVDAQDPFTLLQWRLT
jgi:uncharacterized OB-fold protein